MAFTIQGGLIVGLKQSNDEVILPETVEPAIATQGGVIVGGESTERVAPRASDPVESVFGRQGDVVAEEGDYSIDQMGDVDTTTSAPDRNDFLSWNGTNWTPGDTLDSGTFP